MTPHPEIRRFLKSLPWLVATKRFLWRMPGSAIAGLAGLFLLSWMKNRRVRFAVFDASPRNRLLLSSSTKETYVVSTNDKFIGRQVFADGSFDLQKIEQTVRMLGEGRSNGLLIDVGANIGTICIPAVRRGIFKRAIAIEPDPVNFSLLTANIHLNRVDDRIVVHNLALGSRAGETLEFELSEDNYGDHRVRVAGSELPVDRRETRTISVPSEPLDLLVRIENPEETLVWMDTQGFEGFVLAGAAEALRTRVPLVIEFWPCGLNRTGCYPILKECLISAGYEVMYDLNKPDAATRPIPLSSESLDALHSSLAEEWQFTDLLIR